MGGDQIDRPRVTDWNEGGGGGQKENGYTYISFPFYPGVVFGVLYVHIFVFGSHKICISTWTNATKFASKM